MGFLRKKIVMIWIHPSLFTVRRNVQRRVVGIFCKRNNLSSDGLYWIDPDNNGPIEAHCDMTKDGGGWTMIASVTDEDEVTNWIGDNVWDWLNEDTFGSLDSYETADYKSPLYARLTDVGDILFVDSNDDWLSFSGLLNDSLSNTMSEYTSYQTTTIPFESRNSSDALFAANADIAFNGKDPNGSGCPVSPSSGTSSADSMAGNGCSTYGFGFEYGNSYGDPFDSGFCALGTN